MKKLLMAASALIAITGVAHAQDWSGPYVGAQLGAGARDTTWTDLDNDWVGFNVLADTSDSSGVVVGGSVGYNWQFGAFVLGLQGDLSYADLSSTDVGDQCACVTIDTDVNYLATARANAGFAFGKFLPYITAGYTLTDLENSWTEAGDPTDSWVGVSNETALTYGVGVRYAFSDTWAFGIEALRYDFETETSQNVNGFRMDIENEVDVVQATAAFQF